VATLADRAYTVEANMSAAKSAVDTVVHIGTPEYSEIVEWLYSEAQLLDQGDFLQWLQLTTEDIAYDMPTRVALLPREGSGFVDEFGLFAENHASLTARVKRLQTDQAWAEQPRSRTRHFVSNVLVTRSANGEFHVTAAILVTRLRSNRPLDVFTGERRDTLRRVADTLKLARRRILLDQTVMESHNLSIFF
jgi:3-phenylpropionate/cinnamic acid dioxygenase small subunit